MNVRSMDGKNVFIFLCTQETEPECLEKQMVGTTQSNALWAATIKAGDDIYLFNFNTRFLRGPYTATGGADCYYPTAWRGAFPVQVKVAPITAVTRVADGKISTPSVLRKSKPSGNISKDAAELFSWIQQFGSDPKA